jgi:phenylacetate-coenzyme A ligase PaaK-like adenylate-forming protein
MFDSFHFALQVRRLRVTGRRSREQVHAVQQARWRQLLQEASECSPFYRQRFKGIDLRHCQASDIPPLTKADMMAHFDELVTDPHVRRADLERFIADPANEGTYYLGRYAVCHTSGSQGQPALVVQDRSHALLNVAAEIARGTIQPGIVRLVLRHLWRPARLAVITQKPGFYPSGSSFTYLESAALPFFKLLRLSVFDPMDELAARLNEFQPDYLTGYTSALEAMARQQQAGRLRLRQGGRLRQVTNISEPLPEASRQLIEEAFGVHVADCYALAECLAVSSGCPCGPGSHVNADLALFEVVDDRYRPVPDGEPGSKVLVTNLYNRVQPMIRYEIGDVVTMSRSPCPCGSPMPLIRSIQGRTKERFWVEVDGAYRELPYYLFLAALHHYLDMAEHQVLQTGPNRFLVRAAPLPGRTLSAEKLRQLVLRSVRAEGLADRLTVEAEVVDAIRPDPHTGKLQRAKNLVGPPPGPLESDSRPVESTMLQWV